jgi:GTPase involved in cell partitioning and DNA repair
MGGRTTMIQEPQTRTQHSITPHMMEQRHLGIERLSHIVRCAVCLQRLEMVTKRGYSPSSAAKITVKNLNAVGSGQPNAAAHTWHKQPTKRDKAHEQASQWFATLRANVKAAREASRVATVQYVEKATTQHVQPHEQQHVQTTQQEQRNA